MYNFNSQFISFRIYVGSDIDGKGTRGDVNYEDFLRVCVVVMEKWPER